MNREITNTIMTYVLGALAVLGVVFALQSIFTQRELRSLQVQATVDNQFRMTVEAIANDTLAYSQKNPNPEILHILQAAGAKAPAPAPAPK